MIEYKYGLDKSSKKFVCPSCGKRRFVKYVDLLANTYLGDNYGRCDRQENCCYHNKPNGADSILSYNKVEIKKLNPNFINPNLVPKSLKKYDENNFIKFLQKHFTKEQVEKCILDYKIGTAKLWQGATLFWQIDEVNKVRTGKIMLFNESNGRRIKEPEARVNWVHKQIDKQHYQLQQCLFGLHLFNCKHATPNHQKSASCKNTPCKTYGITESEKTSIIMSIFMPNVIWMATGGNHNYNLSIMLPLKAENVIVYPDKGIYAQWNNTTLQLQKLGFNIKCSSLVEYSSYENGTDLADIYFALENTKSEKIILSDAEKTVQEIAKTNPAIIDLIKAFDLIDDKGNGIRLGSITT